MKPLGTIAIIVIVGGITFIIVDLLTSQFKKRQQDRVDAFGSKPISTVLEDIDNAWKVKAKADIKAYILSDPPSGWLDEVSASAIAKGISISKAADIGADYLWRHGQLRMFKESFKDTGDAWKYYWVVNYLNNNAPGYDVKNPMILEALSKIQDEPQI